MLPLERRRVIDWWLGKAQILIASSVVVFTAMVKVVPSSFGSFEPIVISIQNIAWIVAVVGPPMVGLLQVIRRKYGNPWAWEAIQKILDEFSKEVFGDSADPDDYHRVTLFKHRQWCWAWSPSKVKGWLIAVARSGHLTKEKIRRFRAPDDGEACEGVAGYAWRVRDWVRVPENEKPLPVLSAMSKETEIESYAKSCKVKTESVKLLIRRGKPAAQSFAALRVQLKGKPWGVLVLDSRNPGPIDKSRLDRFKVYANLLTPLLERT